MFDKVTGRGNNYLVSMNNPITANYCHIAHGSTLPYDIGRSFHSDASEIKIILKMQNEYSFDDLSYFSLW